LKKAQTCRAGSRMEPASRILLGLMPTPYEIDLKLEETFA